MIDIAHADLNIKRGDSEEKLITFKKGGKPFDLSVIQRIDMHVKVNGKPVIKLSSKDNSIHILNATQGEIVLNITPILTETKKFEDGEYDIQFIFANGRIKTVLEGNFILDADVTYIKG